MFLISPIWMCIIWHLDIHDQYMFFIVNRIFNIKVVFIACLELFCPGFSLAWCCSLRSFPTPHLCSFPSPTSLLFFPFSPPCHSPTLSSNFLSHVVMEVSFPQNRVESALKQILKVCSLSVGEFGSLTFIEIT